MTALRARQQLLLRLVPFLAIACFLGWSYVAVRSTHAWDDAEPEILNQAWRLANGQPIYSPIEVPPFVHTAYPPVYFAVVGLALTKTGLTYLPAKLISLAAMLSIGLAMVLLARFWGLSAAPGVWFFSILLLIPAVLYNSVRAHPQMLAVALSLFSLIFLLRKGHSYLVLSALLAVAAIYTKQTQIALPIAAIVFFALTDVRRLLIYAVSLLVIAVPPLLVLQARTGGFFLHNTVTLNRLSYSLTELLLVLLHWAGPILLFLGFAVLSCWRNLRRGRIELLDVYFAVAALMTIVSCGRLGAHSQYVVELCVLTLLVVLRESRAMESTTVRRLLRIQVAVLALYCPVFIIAEAGPFGVESNAAAARVYPLLKTVPGEILAQQSSFSLFTNGEIPIQLFHFTALSRAGLWNMGRLEERIQQRAFAWVITEFPIESRDLTADDLERFTPECLAALRAKYSRTEVIGPYYLYRAKER